MSLTQTVNPVWQPSISSVVSDITLSAHKLVTQEITDWNAASPKSVATIGTDVGVFNSITSTQGSDGIKIITDVSGGGSAGSVITPGVAATLASTVVVGISASDTASSGRIPYISEIIATDKLVTLPITYVTGLNNDPIYGFYNNSSTSFVNPIYAEITSNNDGTNTNTLQLFTTRPQTTSVISQSATFATGQLSSNGSGSAVAVQGVTSYLSLDTFPQVPNIPTVVSFGTITIEGTSSYIHTSNITPAIANGTIVGLNTSTTKTLATGQLSSDGSGATVMYGLEISNVSALTSATSITFPVFALSKNETSGIAYINGTKDATVYTASESAHTHSYSKTTSISIVAPTSSAVTDAVIVPAN